MENALTPLRIRLERTKGWRMPPNPRKVGRSTRFGNPEIVNNETGEAQTLTTVAIGAEPRTKWLPPEIAKDAKALVRTGAELLHSPQWTVKREPFLLETSRAGVFAAGDERNQRAASAVDEGAMAVKFMHEYLKKLLTEVKKLLSSQ